MKEIKFEDMPFVEIQPIPNVGAIVRPPLTDDDFLFAHLYIRRALWLDMSHDRALKDCEASRVRLAALAQGHLADLIHRGLIAEGWRADVRVDRIGGVPHPVLEIFPFTNQALEEEKRCRAKWGIGTIR